VTPEDSIRLSVGEQQVWADTITWGGQLFVFEDNDLCGSEGCGKVARSRGGLCSLAARPTREFFGGPSCVEASTPVGGLTVSGLISFTTFTSSKRTSARFTPTHVSPHSTTIY
jgi:hypothetical protein